MPYLSREKSMNVFFTIKKNRFHAVFARNVSGENGHREHFDNNERGCASCVIQEEVVRVVSN